MGDDLVSSPASDTNPSQPTDDQNRPEPQAETPSPASESANSQPETPVASDPASSQPTGSPKASPTPEAPQSTEIPSAEPASISTSTQTEPTISTPSAQVMPPEVEPTAEENPIVQAATELQNITEAEAIPQLHYPYYISYPITFDFGAQPSDEGMKQKYQQWEIVGHNGIDFGLPEGTEVLACDEGIVIQVGDNGDFGISITIKHSWGTSIYCHLQSFGVLVDDHVTKAQVIALSDHTGYATGPHLHFGIQPNNPNINNGYLGYINPNPYLSETSEKPQPEKSPDLSVETPTKEEVPSVPSEPQSHLTPQIIPQQHLPTETSAKEGQPEIPQEEIQKQVVAMFDARLKENSIKGNQAKKDKRDEALQKIFSFAQDKKRVTNEQVRDLLHVSQSTASVYLTELVNRGMLKVEGKGKATIYLY